ncbi:MAG: winged helix-turn-helix domain-containing protein [Caulobacterales bacterium]|uniref:winged helix-turn-helix domain-containing protein n=1 Tax=Glycocaulis sp. TaxID=1969725 RepID=UPI003FA046B5
MHAVSVIIGEWSVDAGANRLYAPGVEREVEARVMDLLMLFAARAGEVLSREDIAAAVWGQVHVNEDALSRSIFKLRKALGDDARNPRFIETVPKRGYRLIAPVTWPQSNDAPVRDYRIAALAGGGSAILAVLVAGFALWQAVGSDGDEPPIGASAARLERADGFYAQYTSSDNAAARRLYEAILAEEPANAAALAGLANTMTQSVIRFEGAAGDTTGRTSLSQALSGGWTDTDTARNRLDDAVALAREATEADPHLARGWRALGLALAARRDFEDAEQAYERALVIDPDDWGSLLNMSELYRLTDREAEATPYLAQAWLAMERRYGDDPVAIRPWHSTTGLAVARAMAENGETAQSALWYRRVLARDPLNADAVRELAQLLESSGDAEGAAALCAGLARAGGETC